MCVVPAVPAVISILYFVYLVYQIVTVGTVLYSAVINRLLKARVRRVQTAMTSCIVVLVIIMLTVLLLLMLSHSYNTVQSVMVLYVGQFICVSILAVVCCWYIVILPTKEAVEANKSSV